MEPLNIGYCRECKRFDEIIRIHDVEARFIGGFSPIEGLFLDDEIELKKDEHGWVGLTIKGSAFDGCKFRYIDEEQCDLRCQKGEAECAFHSMGFNWGMDTYNIIKCNCNDYYEDFRNLDRKETPPCLRYGKVGWADTDEYGNEYPSIPEDFEYKQVFVKNLPSAPYIQTRITNDSVIPIVMSSTSFIHILTFNVDQFFLGMLEALARKEVDVVIVLNPRTLGRTGTGTLRALLNMMSFPPVEENLSVRVNPRVHAKRVFIDGVIDLDLASINLSYTSLCENVENIPEFTFADPRTRKKEWELIKEIHAVKFLDLYDNGIELVDWCKDKRPDIYEGYLNNLERRQKERRLVLKMQD